MSDCVDYTPRPAPAPIDGSDPGLDVELVGLGCVLDVDGLSLGPVFYEPTFDAETGAYTGSILVHIPISTGVPIRPYVGPWGTCPTGSGEPQLATVIAELCAVVDGVGYLTGDKVTLTRIVDLTDPLNPPLVQSFANVSAGVDQIIYLENNGVAVIGTPPPNTDLAACPDAIPCTDCATVPAGSVV